MSTWQMPDAQARLSEVIDKALHEGPQTITDNGVDVIVLAESEYRLLTNRKPTFIEFLLSGPKVDDFTIERDLSQANADEAVPSQLRGRACVRGRAPE
jgi:prevent-host-death family protein